jgi:hypothetical protein
MRRFLIIAHKAPLEPGFSLDDLPGGAGRIENDANRAVPMIRSATPDDVPAILALIRELADYEKLLDKSSSAKPAPAVERKFVGEEVKK